MKTYIISNKQQLCILLFFVVTLNSFAQQSLKKLLWKSVEPCYSQLDEEGDEIRTTEDIKNGYLKISSSCETSVAAFKTQEGNYTTLVRYKDLCNFIYKINSNEKLQNILPPNINLSTFIPEGNSTLFYFDIEPPQKGTDIIVTLKPVPFGIKNITRNPFEYSGYTESFQFFQSLVHKIKDGRTLDFILKKNYKAIRKKEMSLITSEIGEKSPNNRDWSLATVSTKLNKLYKIYQDFESRQYDAFVLGWRRKSGKFYIKKKIKKQKSVTFLQFLKENDFWMAIC